MTDINIDYYSETNVDSDALLYTGYNTKRGQAFAHGATTHTLNSAKFYLKKVGAPTGNMNAALYACTGTPGTNGTGTGAALSTSGTIAVSTLTTTYALVTFTFSTPYTLAASTNYVLVVEYDAGDATNYIAAGYDGSAPTHPGNFVAYAGGFSYDAGRDCCFYAINSSTIPTFDALLIAGN